jgi:hypothetical protein
LIVEALSSFYNKDHNLFDEKFYEKQHKSHKRRNTMSNPYAKYHTDENLTRVGVTYEDEDVRIKVTYAGTENTRYDKMLKLKLKPFETQIRNENFSDAAFHKVLAEVYAATVVLSWEVLNDKKEWVSGIYDENGEILPFSEENVKKGFGLGQRLFSDVIKVATNFNLYRQNQKEDDVKN